MAKVLQVKKWIDYKSLSIYGSATKRKIKFCVMAFANIFQWANFIHRFFSEFLSLKNMYFFVCHINYCIFAYEKSCLTSKRMQIAEIRTVAKSLPLLWR